MVPHDLVDWSSFDDHVDIANSERREGGGRDFKNHWRAPLIWIVC